MSDKPIAVGDLVMVVRGRPCGCASEMSWRTFIVAEIAENPAGDMYPCGHSAPTNIFATPEIGGVGPDLSRLKRIPPLEDLQTFRNTDENPVEPVFDSTLAIMKGNHGA